MQDLYGDWARVYDCFYPDRSSESAFWARQARAQGWRVLDLMCGTAEVSLGLARQGLSVLGVDRSPAMLAEGARRLAAAADYPARNLALVQGDACEIPVSDGQFDFALVGGNGSFNHLDDEPAGQALSELGRVLCPGGGLGLELVNPHLAVEIEPERTFGSLRPPPAGMRLERNVHTHFDTAADQIQIRQTTLHEGRDQSIEFEESFFLHIREPEKIGPMLKDSGFGDLVFRGSHNLEPFGRWS